MQAAGEIESLRPAPVPPRAGGVALERGIGECRAFDGAEHDRRAREELDSILQDEWHRELSLGHDQVDPALSVLHAEKLTQFRLEPVVDRIEIEELGMETDGPTQASFERRPQGLVRAHDRRRKARI